MMPRFPKPKEQDFRILEAMHEKAANNRHNPTMGFRETRKATRMGTQTLSERLPTLIERGYVVATTIGAYKRYYITREGIDYKESLQEMETLAKKPGIIRLKPEHIVGSTATVYFKSISFSELQAIMRPEWNEFVNRVNKQLKDKNCEIGIVGTLKTVSKSS